MKKRMTTGNRYATYLRCSTDEQTDGDYTTIDVQRGLTRKYVEEHDGVFVGEYADPGRTGTDLARTGWEELLKDAQAGLFDVVCCTYLSRLGRGDAGVVAEHYLKKAGVRIELVKERFTDDTAGYMTKQVVRLVDGLYVEQVRQHTRTKMEQMVAQGYFCGGTLPLGYRAEPIEGACTTSDKQPPKRLVIDGDEAEIVREAYRLFLRRGTIATVRDYLSRVTPRTWVSSTAKYLLANPVYIGVQEFGDWRNENAHPAIVDEEIWQAAQDILEASKSRTTRAPRSDSYTYYLRGLVTCPHCGCTYTNSLAKGGAVRYYECLHAKKSISKCPVCRVNSDALHASILREISRAVEHRTVMHRLIAETGGWQNAGDDMKRLRGQLRKKRQFLDVRINNLLNLLGDGRGQASLLDRLDQFEAEKRSIAEEIERLDLQIAQSTVARPTAATVQEVWAKLPELWDYVSEEEKLELMASIVEEVIVKEKNSVSLRLSPIVRNSEFRVRNNSKNGSGGWI